MTAEPTILAGDDAALRNILPQPVIDEVGRFLQAAGQTGGDKDGWKRAVQKTRI